LSDADGELKTALVCLLVGCSPDEARRRIERNGGSARLAVEVGPEA
jgi:N-acetylmuramic acid 6-phosphate (MurNAc-6-P) etherase